MPDGHTAPLGRAGAGVLIVALALWSGACSTLLQFHECDVDGECGVPAGGTQRYCTSDHMCVNALPDERLCVQSVPAPGTPIPDGALIVAGLYRLALPTGVSDRAIRHGADLAALQLTGDAGINVVHYACDTQGSPAQAARALQYAVTRLHAVAAVGPVTSDEVIKGVAPVVWQSGAAVVSPGATSPIITTLADGGLIWRTCGSDNLQAKVLSTLVPTTAPNKLDLVYVDKSAYSIGLAQAFTADYPGAISKTVVFQSGDAASGVAEMDAPDYALLIADSDVPPLVAALQGAKGQTNTQYLMTDAAQAPTLWGPPDARIPWWLLSRIRGTAPALPADPQASAGVYRAFAAEYKAHFGEDPANTSFVANAYDAFYVIAIAAAVAGPHPTGAAIAANLARLSQNGGTGIPVGVNGYGVAVLALQSAPTARINVLGASGPIDFDPATGDVVSAPIEVWKVVMGGDGNPAFAAAAVVTP